MSSRTDFCLAARCPTGLYDSRKKLFNGGLEFKAYFVCDKCDKFAVCGLVACAYCVAEEAVEGVDISSVPCYLNGLAYGSFH